MGTNTNCGARPRAARRSIAADGRGEARSRAHALVRGGRRAVDRDLDAAGPRASARRSAAAVVDAAAVGLDLEGDAVRGEDLEDLPAVRHAERLAAAERDVRRCRTRRCAARDRAPRRGEARRATPCRDRTPRSTRCSARVQRLVSCQARKRGARYSSTERPGIAEGRAISGEADVRLRHHLLGDVLELGRFPRRLADAASTCRSLSSSPVFAGSIVRFVRSSSLLQVTRWRRTSTARCWRAHGASGRTTARRADASTVSLRHALR